MCFQLHKKSHNNHAKRTSATHALNPADANPNHIGSCILARWSQAIPQEFWRCNLNCEGPSSPLPARPCVCTVHPAPLGELLHRGFLPCRVCALILGALSGPDTMHRG